MVVANTCPILGERTLLRPMSAQERCGATGGLAECGWEGAARTAEAGQVLLDLRRLGGCSCRLTN